MKPTIIPITKHKTNAIYGFISNPELDNELPANHALNIAEYPATDSIDRSKLPLIKQ
jgi:hypothetical protein